MSTNPFPSTGPRLGNVRVVSLNLWGRNGAWADRRSVLIDGFRALRPDLVALQEVIKNDEYDQMTSPIRKAEILRGWVSRSRAAGRWEKCESWTYT